MTIHLKQDWAELCWKNTWTNYSWEDWNFQLLLQTHRIKTRSWTSCNRLWTPCNIAKIFYPSLPFWNFLFISLQFGILSQHPQCPQTLLFWISISLAGSYSWPILLYSLVVGWPLTATKHPSAVCLLLSLCGMGARAKKPKQSNSEYEIRTM